ncbi:YadA-like family protein, partial [Phascolarctobacterium succinatutens]|uniref:YadA-like family protein n=3 Tax=Phascolarctobacterium succinatutens TaxID=626940 RepID=UPI00307A117D
IKANKAEADEQHKYLNSRTENNTANIDKNKVAIENEAAARKDADKKLNAKIDSNAAKVQEQLDAQDGKNKAQDASIKANGQAIAANKDAIKANADAIKANKAEADEQHKYLNSRVENNTANIDKNKVAIENETQARVDADKALRADLNQETIDRVDADNRLQTAIDQKADKTTVAENTAAIESNKAAIAQEKKDRDHADQKLQDQITINKGQIENEATNRANEDKKLNAKIDAETDARKDADNALRTDLNQETIDRVDADNRLQTAINQKADKTTVAENTAAIESNKAAIAQEKKDRDHADQKLQDQITINKGQIENEATNRANEDKRIEAKFDGEVSRLDGRIDKLDANVEKVGAMAAAIANLHTMGYDPEAPTEIAVGVGQYRDKTGLALGAFHYPNRDFMLSFNVSTAGDEFMGGIGATWRFGRKSPEELRQAEAEKAAKAKLAKAEAAKKAAKDARVAAQQKRHAEMLAARTGK